MPLKHPSNYQLVVEARERSDFEHAMAIAMDSDDRKATHFEEKDGVMTVYSYAEPGAKDLPYQMGLKNLTQFLWGWLETQYPRKDTMLGDGSIDPDGFRLEGGHWPVMLKLKKVFSQYHK